MWNFWNLASFLIRVYSSFNNRGWGQNGKEIGLNGTWGAHGPLTVRVNGSDWWKGVNYVKMVIGYSILVKVSVYGGILTMAGSW